MHTAQLVG